MEHIINPTVQNLIEHCLQSDPDRRLTAAEILNHDFFTGESKLKRRLELDFIESNLEAALEILQRF